jgi:hypothetical protein
MTVTAALAEWLQGKAKPRKNGTLPFLPGGHDLDLEILREFVTMALRPPKGWRVVGFDRAGRDDIDPCTVAVQDGREHRTFRFRKQGALYRNLRATAVSVSDGFLNVPHLSPGEVEDVWAALCTLGRVLTEYDERDDARKWIEQMVPATMPLNGHTLVPDGRHDALMALRAAGEFTRPDALALARPGEDQRFMQRPCRFLDSQTGYQYLRAGETAAFVRWVLGVEPLSAQTLTARLTEIGVVMKLFEDHKPPHPKLRLYQLSDELAATFGLPA